MPQAIQPGSYLALYGQQLQKTVLTQAQQPQAAATPANPANLAVLAQADAALATSVAGMDTMLANVGIGIANGSVAAGAPPVTVPTAATPPGAVPNNLAVKPAIPAAANAGTALGAAPTTPLGGVATPTATTNIFAVPPTGITAAKPVAKDVTQPSAQTPMMPMVAKLLETLLSALTNMIPPATIK